jgi:hypothetical protein
MCADDVEATFRAAFESGGMSWDTFKWHFRYDKGYKPTGKKPTSGGIASSLKNHIQGFVRTNNDTMKYAASHSNSAGHKGGYYFTKKTNRNDLSVMQLSNTDHPYSVAELGQYVVSAEDEDVRFFDLRKIEAAQNVVSWVPGLDAGGGMAMGRLADGAHILVSSFPGGRSSGTRYTDFYRWEGPLTAPTDVTRLARVPYSQPSSWSGNYKYSDNLSLITECGSGRLYTIHTSGDEKIVNSKGYWRLSRVDWDAGGVPTLKTLSAKTQSQRLNSCHLRSSGTVHVNGAHDLQFICHERNVVKILWEKSDYFSFKFGTPKA